VTLRCANCNADNSDGDGFCRNCGRPLATAPAAPVRRAASPSLPGPLLVAGLAGGLILAASLGVLIASVTRTLQQALLVSFFGLFPILFLSGTMVPIESMPRGLQLVSLASPLRHYMEVILGVFLKGAGFADLWPQTLALLAIGTVLFTSALIAFRR